MVATGAVPHVGTRLWTGWQIPATISNTGIRGALQTTSSTYRGIFPTDAHRGPTSSRRARSCTSRSATRQAFRQLGLSSLQQPRPFRVSAAVVIHCTWRGEHDKTPTPARLADRVKSSGRHRGTQSRRCKPLSISGLGSYCAAEEGARASRPSALDENTCPHAQDAPQWRRVQQKKHVLAGGNTTPPAGAS